jgi:hypothetical protein
LWKVWYIFFRFGLLHHEKSGKPDENPFKKLPSGTVSICTLAMLSVHRLMSVKNIQRAKIATYSNVLALILFIWLYTLTISVPPFFGFGAFVPETSGMT